MDRAGVAVMVRGHRTPGLLAVAILVGTAQTAVAGSLAALSPPIVASGDARAPLGWVGFCSRYPSDCAVDTAEPDRIHLSADALRTLRGVNTRVNTEIAPMTDVDHWGTAESWDYPDDGKGDCEDYALLKRKRLVEAGFPRRALLMTVVLDEERLGHAVLTVRTDRGDLILDNKTSAVKPWTQTGYAFIKRESQTAAAWVSLGGFGSAVATGR